MAFTHRSEPTRSAILTAARRLLAEKGYEATTIRGVAAEAGIDPSMVMRYYGNKEGLFAAALDVDLQLDKIDTSCAPDELGERLARHVIARWEGPLSDETITLLLRTASTHPVAAEQIRRVFASQVLRMIRDVIGEDADTPRRIGMVSTQVLGLALCRYVLRLPPVVAMDAETVATTMAPVLQHYLTGDLDGAGQAQVVRK
jgi:AcrR family transcriptional regulator